MDAHNPKKYAYTSQKQSDSTKLLEIIFVNFVAKKCSKLYSNANSYNTV